MYSNSVVASGKTKRRDHHELGDGGIGKERWVGEGGGNRLDEDSRSSRGRGLLQGGRAPRLQLALCGAESCSGLATVPRCRAVRLAGLDDANPLFLTGHLAEGGWDGRCAKGGERTPHKSKLGFLGPLSWGALELGPHCTALYLAKSESRDE